MPKFQVRSHLTGWGCGMQGQRGGVDGATGQLATTKQRPTPCNLLGWTGGTFGGIYVLRGVKVQLSSEKVVSGRGIFSVPEVIFAATFS